MSEAAKNVIAAIVGFGALAVITVGLTTAPSAPASAEDRVESLSASIKCPFCNGESLAESTSSVAADYRDLIAERVADGASDEAILDEFAGNFGASYVYGSSGSRWAFLLWLLPAVVLVVGIGVVVALWRSSRIPAGESR